MTGQDTPVLLTDEHRLQVAGWRRMVIVLAVALFAQSAAFGVSLWTGAQSRQEEQAVTNCRGKSAAALSDAQVSNDIALDNLVLALAARTAPAPGKTPYQDEIEGIGVTVKALGQARDARVAFEEHPTGHC